MLILNNEIVYSPSDLTLYMQSEFASWMERYYLEYSQEAPIPDAADSMMSLLGEKGSEHEHETLQTFVAKGLKIADISKEADAGAATLSAMDAGVEVIFQGELSLPPFRGYTDFLVKVPGRSQLGDYKYEIWDTKLSKHLKPHFVVQLSCYADMLEKIQGCPSEFMTIVLGDGSQEQLRVDDYIYYYKALKNRYLESQEAFNKAEMPDPADSKSWGRWQSYAKQVLAERDHLSQVATMSRSQIKRFEKAGINSMASLARASQSNIPGINTAVFKRLKAQAKLQIASAGADVPEFEVVKPEHGEKKGLALLPPHSPLDVFFDIEGFPLEDGGLEYLWGNTYFDESGERQFIDFWAHDREQEKQCFHDFIQWVYDRWQRDPSMHIYHYANYEIAACRKLMSRYGVCEYEVDQLLRNEVFVDLYKVVKNGMIIGEPNYSIKSVEHLYRDKRDTEVGNGGDSVVVYENWRTNPDGDTWETSKVLKDIRDYNIDDCDSTQELVDWLRERQKEHDIQYIGKVDIVEPPVREGEKENTDLRDSLLLRSEALIPSDEKKARLIENLAWILEFHRREAKPVFWRLFDRLGLSEMELFDDLDCLALCSRTATEPYKLTARKKKFCYEYEFDVKQEFKNGSPKEYYILGLEKADGKPQTASFLVEESDINDGLIVLESGVELPNDVTLIPNEYIGPGPIQKAIESVIKDYEKLGAPGENDRAIFDFLERSIPRIKGIGRGEAIAPSHDPECRLDQIITAVKNLDHSYLPIQGPPGAGKTYTGKHVIAELLKQGKKVGICSNSHKAINNLLIGTARYCVDKNISANFACTKETDEELLQLGVSILENKNIADNLNGACVIGTTAWGFSREDLAGEFDYLFVDEAGQVSVANLIAISRCADNLVLMGDQMQLGQPAQGTHPAESGLSTLDYLLHEQPTIDDHQGVFLGTTYRMHSKVNQFISDAIYEGKLESDPENDKQTIEVPSGYMGSLDKSAGIVFVPVAHEGNTQASEEEVAEISSMAKELLGRRFTAKDGTVREIDWEDMLFVAPYNHQVNKLKAVLGEQAKVGSVDKFQGQEAPVVFLSMCASRGDDSPRGIDFLFDKNRINVAVSRAQALAVVVGSPTLSSTSASSVNQQAKVNLFAFIQQVGC